jgi:hypothetical protein
VQRWSLAVGGFLMLLLQCVACVTVLWGMVLPSCVTNDQCGVAGTFCAGTKRCSACGWASGMPIQVDPATGLASNHGNDPGNRMGNLPAFAHDWSGGFNTSAAAAWCAGEPVCGYRPGGSYDGPYDVLSCGAPGDGRPGTPDLAMTNRWCDACVHPVTGTVDATIFWEDTVHNNVAAMVAFDWMVLLLATGVAAMTVVAELRDITLCLLALDRADRPVPAGWRVALRSLAMIRRYTFLPLMVTMIPVVVLFQGGDALSICFNTVAVLFLAEVE